MEEKINIMKNDLSDRIAKGIMCSALILNTAILSVVGINAYNDYKSEQTTIEDQAVVGVIDETLTTVNEQEEKEFSVEAFKQFMADKYLGKKQNKTPIELIFKPVKEKVDEEDVKILVNNLDQILNNVTDEQNKKEDNKIISDYEYVKGEIVVGGTQNFLSESTAANVYNYMAQAEANGKKVSFMIADPETGVSVSYNAKEKVNPCCTIKAGVALSIAEMIENGEASWDDMLTYQSWNTTGGSGVIKFEKPGTKFTLRQVVHLLLNISDNSAMYMIDDHYGMERQIEILRSIGCENVRDKEYDFCIGDMTANDIAIVWGEIYRRGHIDGEKLNQAIKNGEEVNIDEYSPYAVIYNEFLNAQYNDLKGTYFPEWESAHKSGWSTGQSNARNDAGIVYTVVEDDAYSQVGEMDSAIDSPKLYNDMIVVIMTSPNDEPDSKLGDVLEDVISDYANVKDVILMEKDIMDR